jgi:hypothetical protein
MAHTFPTVRSFIRTACLLAIAILLLGVSAFAQPFVCLTGDRTFVEAHARPLPETPRIRQATANALSHPLDIRDGLAFFPGDDAVIFGWKPFDLAGRSLTFTPNADGSYRVKNDPLEVDPDRGTKLSVSGSVPRAVYQPTRFHPVIFGETPQKLFVSQYNGIHLTEPEVSTVAQYGTFGALHVPGGVLSPLLITPAAKRGFVDIYAKETDSSLTFTWQAPFFYEVRASFRQGGVIVFSYVSSDIVTTGAVVLSSGKESWRQVLTSLASISDPVGNVHQAPTPKLALADITAVKLSRGPSDWLRFEIEVASPVDPALLGPGETISYVFIAGPSSSGGFQFGLDIDHTGISRAQGTTIDRPLTAISGNTITFEAPRGSIPISEATTFRLLTSVSSGGSGLIVNDVAFTAPIRETPSIETDFGRIDQMGISGAIIQTFALGGVADGSIWNLLKAGLGVSDETWDAVAIYTNFRTDIWLQAYNGSRVAAYAVPGNPAADGIGQASSTTARPRAVTRLNMNVMPQEVAYVPNRSDLLLHEFGHRWLYGPTFLEGNNASHLLSPDGAHPAQWVDTRAAFPVDTPKDSSPMGGGFFSPAADSTFMASTNSISYSWLDLYLMGLAAPEEVPPLFYLANSSPALGSAYYPPAGTYHGERRDVALDEIRAALGTRNPSTATSQRIFRVAFVLIYDPAKAPTPTEVAVLRELRSRFLRDFGMATGGRGQIVASLPIGPEGRRRAVAH